MELASLKGAFEAGQRRYVAEWRQLLSFPSVSTDPAHERDCLDCADWLVEHISRLGFNAQRLETTGKPVVFGERPGAPDKPAVLFYGHYDVQPADPLEAWTTPPFEPQLRGGRMYARGAQDNKGQLFAALKAVETLVEGDALDCTLKIIIEGEEESGSQGISSALERWREQLRADILMVGDTGTVSSGAPTIIMGLRGAVHLTVSLTGPTHDLHSGTHGGRAPNPAEGMACLVGRLRDATTGRIAVGKFYDQVRPPSREERELANAHDGDEASYRAETGVPSMGGEREFTPTERVGFRPSLDINGIHTGYDGAGMKTIIPSVARAKITARLVPDQDPAACLANIIRHLQDHTPEGLELRVDEQGALGPGFRLDLGSPLIRKAKAVLDQLDDRETAFLWEGASVPVVSSLAQVSGAEPLLVGFGSEQDRIHAPDESFSLDQFSLDYLYTALMLTSL